MLRVKGRGIGGKQGVIEKRTSSICQTKIVFGITRMDRKPSKGVYKIYKEVHLSKPSNNVNIQFNLILVYSQLCLVLR